MHGVIQKWTCGKLCGWSRSWHDSPQYLDRFIEHPLYGPITGRNLVRADIEHHNCEDFIYWKEVRRPFLEQKAKEREAASTSRQSTVAS